MSHTSATVDLSIVYFALQRLDADLLRSARRSAMAGVVVVASVAALIGLFVLSPGLGTRAGCSARIARDPVSGRVETHGGVRLAGDVAICREP